MIVYRIARPLTQAEREQEWLGKKLAPVGHWHGPHIGPATKATWNYSLPTPHTDGPKFIRHEIQAHEVCGTASVEKLLEWFDKMGYHSITAETQRSSLEVMAEEGFRFLTLYVPFTKVHVLANQVVFPWADAVIVKDQCVSVLLREKASG